MLPLFREEINEQLDWLYTNDVCAYPVTQGGKTAKVSCNKFIQKSVSTSEMTNSGNKKFPEKRRAQYLILFIDPLEMLCPAS